MDSVKLKSIKREGEREKEIRCHRKRKRGDIGEIKR